MDFFLVERGLNCHGQCPFICAYSNGYKLPWTVSGVDGLLFKLGTLDYHNERYFSAVVMVVGNLLRF